MTMNCDKRSGGCQGRMLRGLDPTRWRPAEGARPCAETKPLAVCFDYNTSLLITWAKRLEP